MYVVSIDGRKGLTLFLVDRRVVKDRWWTSDVSMAFLFKKSSAASIQAKKLIYKSPQVIPYSVAKMISDDQFGREYDEPFSNED